MSLARLIMAQRPIFIPNIIGNNLVKQEKIDFTWFPGYSIMQKQKSIESLHSNAKKYSLNNILEISTKSLTSLGKSLSAFNLRIRLLDDKYISIESAYQGSKVFENGGPFVDLYFKSGFDIKKDIRLKESGNLIGFLFEEEEWELNPKTAFYDWLYLKGLYQNNDLSSNILDFDGFSDIEYNPEKSISCQARTAALFVSLSKRNLLNTAMRRKQDYLDILVEYKEIFIPKEKKSKLSNKSDIELF